MSYSARFARNRGFISKQEQSVLATSSVAIAGVGGDGGMLSLQLARLGVGRLTLADPEEFELENVNRQALATSSTVGQNKADVLARAIRDVNPDCDVRVFRDGVTEANEEEFLAGANLLVDETEITTPAVAVNLARRARAQGIANMTVLNIGFSTICTSFTPESIALEDVLGTPTAGPPPADVPLSRWLPYLPTYVDLDALDRASKGEIAIPSVAPGVALAASFGATQAFLALLRDSGNLKNRPTPIVAPRVGVIDLMTGRSKTVRFSPVSHYRHLGAAFVRNLVGRTPSGF